MSSKRCSRTKHPPAEREETFQYRTLLPDDMAASALGFVDREAIRCFQCSSAQGADDEDTCGAYTKFDKTHHIAIECNSDESSSPGTFCMKVTQQGPKGFICASSGRGSTAPSLPVLNLTVLLHMMGFSDGMDTNLYVNSLIGMKGVFSSRGDPIA
uniref:Uncharacterized protein n=1 Tax=Timema bartmani TaxID=61472 RepID=A0A7R9I6V3_9NEOP|nr:unnamed protein product [Timema bartmani]